VNEITQNAGWQRLRAYTPARIGLTSAGAHVATAVQLQFQSAHAEARDAVHAAFDPASIANALGERALLLESAARDRATYLTRPDLGRRLSPASRAALNVETRGWDLALVVADGLSATAVHRHAIAVIDSVRPALKDWRIAPIAVVERGRVAVGDEIGEVLDAALVAVLIGERPGLSSPDSLGIYVTWAPRIGRTDAERNCISNVRPTGLGYAEAARKLAYLLHEGRRRRLTGVMLKDETALPGPHD